MVCDSNGDWKDSSDLVCQANSCDIDDIAKAVAYVDYSSCHGKTSGEVCTPVCSPGTDQITNVSQPIHLVCDADGDFVHDIALTWAVVANVARLNASLSNVTDIVISSTPGGCLHSPCCTWQNLKPPSSVYHLEPTRVSAPCLAVCLSAICGTLPISHLPS